MWLRPASAGELEAKSQAPKDRVSAWRRDRDPGTIILAGRLRAMLDAGVWMTAGIRTDVAHELASMPRLYDPGGRDADLPPVA